MNSAPASGPVLPGQTLGVMGGGQLGRMFAHAAQRLGYSVAVLEPDAGSPAGQVSQHHIQTDYADAQGLQRMVELCAAVTTEFENVPAPALVKLGSSVPVAPAAGAVAIAQDRALEKAHFVRCGVPCAPHVLIETAQQLGAVSDTLLPGILKTCRLGYDGKGQVRVTNRQELAQAWADLGQAPCVLERRLPLLQECSVIVARGADGACVNLPAQRNTHRDGILALTEVYEGNLAPALMDRAVCAAKRIAIGLQYIGVLCVEFFVLEPDSALAQELGPLVVNEMAPRPHNSGHYSIDACDVSQFELQVRALARLPLVQPRQHSPAIMLNLLGDIWPDGGGSPSWERLLALPGTHLHLYGKAQARRGRKMGHLNVTGPNIEQVRATAREAARLLGIEPI